MASFKGVEIFRAGEHVSSEGVKRTYTEADLDRIAAYDRAKHEAPVVVGHPKDNAPAYGWAGRVFREGPLLKADLDDVDDNFAELVKAGRFKKRSISLYPDGTLRHIGFLGAVPPAIKGLKDVAFAEGEALTFEEQIHVSPMAKFISGLRAFLDGPEARQVMTDQPDNPAGDQTPPAAFQEEDMADAETKKQLDELTAQMAQFSEQLKTKDEKISELEKANQALSAKLDNTSGVILHKDLNSFAEANLARILPANKARAVAVMDALAKAGPVNFAEEGQDPAERNPLELFKEMVSALPEQVEFREVATKARGVVNPGGLTAEAMAKKIDVKRAEAAKLGREMSFAEAQSEVLKEQEGTK
jgi:DNA-binding transcriptional MerR regulator